MGRFYPLINPRNCYLYYCHRARARWPVCVLNLQRPKQIPSTRLTPWLRKGLIAGADPSALVVRSLKDVKPGTIARFHRLYDGPWLAIPAWHGLRRPVIVPSTSRSALPSLHARHIMSTGTSLASMYAGWGTGGLAFSRQNTSGRPFTRGTGTRRTTAVAGPSTVYRGLPAP